MRQPAKYALGDPITEPCPNATLYERTLATVRRNAERKKEEDELTAARQVARQEQARVAEPLAHSANLAWRDCLDHAVAVFARQSEPAETVVGAAFGACSSEESVLVAREAEFIGRPAGDTIEYVKGKLQPTLLAEVLAWRAHPAAPVPSKPIETPDTGI
jgi:hypothetical protein